MRARRTTGHDGAESQRDRGGAEERWMLAVGKRIHHRWTVEMMLGRGPKMVPVRAERAF